MTEPRNSPAQLCTLPRTMAVDFFAISSRLRYSSVAAWSDTKVQARMGISPRIVMLLIWEQARDQIQGIETKALTCYKGNPSVVVRHGNGTLCPIKFSGAVSPGC